MTQDPEKMKVESSEEKEDQRKLFLWTAAPDRVYKIFDPIENATIIYYGKDQMHMSNVKYQFRETTIPVFRLGFKKNRDSLGFGYSLLRRETDHYQQKFQNQKFIECYGYNPTKNSNANFNRSSIPHYAMSGFSCSDSIINLSTCMTNSVWYCLDENCRIRHDCVLVHDKPGKNHVLYLTKKKIDNVEQWRKEILEDPCMKTTFEHRNGQWKPVAFMCNENDQYKLKVNNSVKERLFAHQNLESLYSKKTLEVIYMNEDSFWKDYLNLSEKPPQLTLPIIITDSEMTSINKDEQYNYQTKVILKSIKHFSTKIKKMTDFATSVRSKFSDITIRKNDITLHRHRHRHRRYLYPRRYYEGIDDYLFYHINYIYNNLIQIKAKIFTHKLYCYTPFDIDEEVVYSLRSYNDVLLANLNQLNKTSYQSDDTLQSIQEEIDFIASILEDAQTILVNLQPLEDIYQLKIKKVK